MFSAKWTAVSNEQHKQSDMEKQGQQALKTSAHWKGGQACSSAFPTLSWQGLPSSIQLSVSCPSHLWDEQNTECWMPECFLSSALSPRQTAVIEAVRKEWHREKLACCLLVTPLTYHSLRLYSTAIKGQPNDEAVCRGDGGRIMQTS